MEQHEIIVPSGVTRELVIVHNSPESVRRVIRLAGNGARVEIDEIFVSGEISSDLVILHEASSTVSRVRSRGVVDKGQVISAHATVRVPHGVTGCITQVEQKFLLLDKSARIDVLPALEIEEQDVTAGHKAAIAPLNEETVFYMMARGFTEVEAKGMLIRGFLRVPDGFAQAVGKWQ